MRPWTAPTRSALVLLVALSLHAAASAAQQAQPTQPATQQPAAATRRHSPVAEQTLTPVEREALLQRLEAERARLARLQAELEQAKLGAVGPPPADAAPKPPAPAAKQGDPKPAPGAAKEADETAAATPPRRPSLGAADVLYRLGRCEAALAAYEAVAAEPKVARDDRIWALLQAGNCCRRLGRFDAAIEHFQTLIGDYPDNPWSTGHVAWAVRTAQWEKRWHRIELQRGE